MLSCVLLIFHGLLSIAYHHDNVSCAALHHEMRLGFLAQGLEKRKTSLLATIFGSDRVMKTHDEGGARIRYRDCDVKKLVKMGFSKDQAVQALLLCDHSVPRAAEVLLGSGGNSHMLSDNR